MGRAPCCDKNGLKKGPWTPEEDQKLIDHIQNHGYGNWRTLPKNAGLQRCGKSCRLRWTNYLRPDIKRGRFSFEEEETIIQLHGILGNKWSAIAARLPGRTDNEIKNYWNTHIRKRLLRMGIDPVTHSPRLDLLDLSSIFNSIDLYNNYSFGLQNHHHHHVIMNTELLKLATSLFSSSSSSHPHQQQNNLPSNTSFHHQLVQNQNHNRLISCPPPPPAAAAAPPPLHVRTPASQQLQEPIIPNASASPMSLQVDSTPPPCFPYPLTHHDQEARVIDPSFNQYPAVNDITNQGFGAAAAPNCATTSTTPLADHHQWQSHDDTSGFIQDQFLPDHHHHHHHVPADFYAFYTSGSDQTNNNVFDPSPDNSTSNYHSSSFGGGAAQQNFNFASVLSTPSSSPTPLNSNSNSTYINGCSTTTTTTATEDERESYCSSILKFEIPDILDVSDCFM